ncbi:MAG: DUF3332 domain-containing protein [Muribaculaceae bacterium]|nr:DUF3332 domain-containing protein [Muribaculaceae bacterium]
MKKNFLKVAVVLALVGSISFSSCIGSFSLSNKLLTWNKNVGDKFVNELVFFAFWILPVYEVTLLADILVLNSIEFWSGNSPVAEGTKLIQGEDQRYLVKCDKKGYTITGETDRQVVRLDFDEMNRSWSVSVNDQDPITFMTFIDDSHVKMITPNGSFTTVETSQQGVLAYSEIAATKLLAHN